MTLSILAMVGGLALLTWSANRFVDGAVHVSDKLGVSPLLIGMVVVGFGTSAPEMLVSGLAAVDGQADLAIGNAYGSNIANIGLILGLAALVAPIAVRRGVIRWELPLLTVTTLFAVAQLFDGFLSRLDAAVLLALFGIAMGMSIRREMRARSFQTYAPPAAPAAPPPSAPAAVHDDEGGDALADTIDMFPPEPPKLLDAVTAVADDDGDPVHGEALDIAPMSTGMSVFWLVAGLAMMIAASRALVYGAVNIATALGVSQLVIGLTIVSVGTSLPELAASVVSARKGQGDLALGNVLGSNIFNTLAVVGISGMITPFAVPAGFMGRDVPAMVAFTVSLFALGWVGKKTAGCIGRGKGVLLLAAYAGYVAWLIATAA